MAGFTGAELAGLLREGVLIVTEPKTSRHMARTMRTMGGTLGMDQGRHSYHERRRGQRHRRWRSHHRGQFDAQDVGSDLPPQPPHGGALAAGQDDEEEEEAEAGGERERERGGRGERRGQTSRAKISLELTHYLRRPLPPVPADGLGTLARAKCGGGEECTRRAAESPGGGPRAGAWGGGRAASERPEWRSWRCGGRGGDGWEDGGRWVSGSWGRSVRW